MRSLALRIIGLDLRSLALMRIALGTVLLLDLLVRLRHFRMFYTDQGALPLETLFRYASMPGDISIYTVNGSVLFTALLFAIHLVSAFCLIAGYRTTAATAVAWFFTGSLHDRNFALLNGGDNWLRLLLMWAIFLPWGACWSIDAAAETQDDPGGRSLRVWTVASAATAAYLLQEFSVYFFSGLHKQGPTWWKDGTAIYYALQLDEWSSSLARPWLYLPGLLKILTYGVLASELALPVLLLSPWGVGPLRCLAVACFLLFHASLLVVMKLGMFPAIGMAGALGLLPSAFWNGRAGRGLQARLDKLWRFRKPLPGTSAYRDPGPSRWGAVAVAILAALGLIWNIASLHYRDKIPYGPQVLGHFLNLDQNWALFAPDPPTRTGWMVVEGVLQDGRAVDLLGQGGEATRRRPPTPAEIYLSQREKRFFVVLGNPDYKNLYPAYTDYLFRRWRAQHPEQPLRGIRLIWMSQQTLPNFEDRPPVTNVLYEAKAP